MYRARELAREHRERDAHTQREHREQRQIQDRSWSVGRASTRGQCGLRGPDTIEVMVTRTLHPVTHLLNISDKTDRLQVGTERASCQTLVF